MIFSRFWTILFLCVSLYVVGSGAQALARRGQAIREHAQIVSQWRLASKKQDSLAQTMAQLHSSAYLEALARKKLGLVKPGEVVYKIVEL